MNTTFFIEVINEESLNWETKELRVTKNGKLPFTMNVLFDVFKKQGRTVKLVKWVEGDTDIEILRIF